MRIKYMYKICILLLLLCTSAGAYTIKGPVTISLDDPKIQAHIREHGIKLPFKGNIQYSNSKIDSWFRIKDGKDLKRPVRNKITKKIVWEKEAIPIEKGLN